MMLLISIVFVLGYVLITLEHHWKINKSITATALAASMWAIIALSGFDAHALEEVLHEVSAETFALVAFLLAAMTLVEILVHYRFFDWLRVKLFALGLEDRGQLILIAGIAFFLSAIIYNLTTTIMIWLAEKFTASQILLWGFLPSATICLVSTFLFARQIEGDTPDDMPVGHEEVVITRSDKVVIVASFASFALPPFAHFIGLPPFMGVLLGVGIVGLIIGWFANTHPEEKTHLAMDIEKLLGKVDITSLLFFIGILFAVGALGFLGILEQISNGLFGENPADSRLIMGSVVLGAFSAIFDNIPLTAAALDILHTTDFRIWVLLAICVGTGGSMLVIGSAAGVVAMGMVKELTFKQFLKIATVPALAGYVAGVAVWYLQYLLF